MVQSAGISSLLFTDNLTRIHIPAFYYDVYSLQSSFITSNNFIPTIMFIKMLRLPTFPTFII